MSRAHEAASAIRSEVRSFLESELEKGTFTPACDSWIQSFDPDFSRKIGRRGWLGITWPARWGGRAGSPLERFVVLEELLAVGAPVAAHWMGERQTGPMLLKYGSERMKEMVLPGIARGEIYISLGMSEPNSGSDLASVSTRAVRTGDGWTVTGQKIWTSNASRAHYLVALARTDMRAEKRAGLSQLLIPLDHPGVTVRRISTMNGGAEFCEVFLDDVRLGEDALIGCTGQGWVQVTAELGHERGGPERYMSVYPLLRAYVEAASRNLMNETLLGSTAARLWALRALSFELAGGRDNPKADLSFDVPVSKDQGTTFEQWVVEEYASAIADHGMSGLSAMRGTALLTAPSFTLRGGTNEVLRTVIARRMVARS